MMDGGMGSMMNSIMGCMMGIGALGWVLVIALLVAILVTLVRLLSERKSSGGHGPTGGHTTDRSNAP
jgi:hypothetical protein